MLFVRNSSSIDWTPEATNPATRPRPELDRDLQTGRHDAFVANLSKSLLTQVKDKVSVMDTNRDDLNEIRHVLQSSSRIPEAVPKCMAASSKS